MNLFSMTSKARESASDIIARNLAGVETHFHAEDSSCVEEALAAFTDDGVWEAPNPSGLHKRIEGKALIRPFYEKLFSTMKDVTFHITYERFATVDRVVDDSICTFQVCADGVWPYPVGTHVFMRIVHVFDMHDRSEERRVGKECKSRG